MKMVTILTDFGYQDPYVGVMKGVISNIDPEIKIVDISHDIPSFGIKHAAFSLFSYYKYFPLGTVHLIVVDPGVGSERRAIALKIDGMYFVLPDNGIISYVWERGRDKKAYTLENQDYFLKPISNTFHGRDIFSPVAAYLAKGINIESVGSFLSTPVLFPFPMPKRKGHILYGEVIYTDKFGNVVTNIKKEDLSPGSSFTINLNYTYIKRIVKYYGEAEKGERFGIFGSTGFLELSENQGRLSDSLGAKIGDKIEVIFES